MDEEAGGAKLVRLKHSRDDDKELSIYTIKQYETKIFNEDRLKPSSFDVSFRF